LGSPDRARNPATPLLGFRPTIPRSPGRLRHPSFHRSLVRISLEERGE
jgi:hypothetical protein